MPTKKKAKKGVDWNRYRKFAVAGAGALVLILTRHFGADSTAVFDVVAILTALGVYGVPNKT